jgi:transitional endoplasmic reticulum ATPase
VVILGATNRPDLIDPALLRPGRFDEMVYVPIPDRKARRAIYEAHTRKMAVARDVDLEELAGTTERYSGADIAGVCLKAGLLALRENAEAREVGMEHFRKAIRETTPSITAEMEEEYRKLAEKAKQETNRIGFGRPK